MLDIDARLAGAIYGHFAAEARAPGVAEMAAAIGASEADVRSGYARLYARRMLVMMPDGESIRMAPPFSGVPTQHVVRAGGHEYFANCAWDALGVPAALHAEAEVRSGCGCCGAPLALHVAGNGPESSSWVFHAAVPAAHWWRDIVYT
ncbi:MAG TPA: organomercurial lyase [Vicinamibacterales bacterium]|nr:organomercurial lyase [Vicinamibacterales bacterium]